MHFYLKIWHLVATIPVILMRINWPNLVQFSIYQDVLGIVLTLPVCSARVRKHYYSRRYAF